MFEIMLRDHSVIRFRAGNIHIAIARMKKEKAVSLIKVTANGMPIGKFNGIKFIKWGE